MPGLVPGIHDFASSNAKVVDGRDKPGHDEPIEGKFNLSAKLAGRIRAPRSHKRGA
jgi:hypothetical protein